MLTCTKILASNILNFVDCLDGFGEMHSSCCWRVSNVFCLRGCILVNLMYLGPSLAALVLQPEYWQPQN